MKLVLLAKIQVVMATFISILVLLLTSAFEDVHSTCDTPQFVEYGQDGPLKCRFEEDTVGLYWYELINSTYELQIKLDAVEGGDVAISGPGYLDGNFDILDDGSLMIFNVTNYHTRNFKAVHVNTNYLVTEDFVELVTSILSSQKFPSVSVCDGDSICFVDSKEFYNLTCSYHQSRPAVEMVWYRQSHEGVELITGKNPSIFKDGKWTFSSVLILDVTNLINGPLIAFICSVSSPSFNSITMESTVVIYTNERKWQSLVQPNRAETYHLINTSAEVCCSKAGKSQLFLWKELREGYPEARVLYINGMEKYLSNFTSEWRLSPEGCIVVDRMTFLSQGLYTCISTNDRQYYSMENEVNVQVPPTPPFIVADGCALENKHCSISLLAENNLLSISCTVKGVYPRIYIGMEGDYFSNDTKVITQIQSARDGETYDVMAKVLLHPQECGMEQNVTCFTNGSKRLQIVSDKTITIQTACATKNLKALAVMIALLIIPIVLVVIYYRRTKQKQNFQNETGDTEKNEGDSLSEENSNVKENETCLLTERVTGESENAGTHVSEEVTKSDIKEENNHKNCEVAATSETTSLLDKGAETEVHTQLNTETGETKKNAEESLSEENSNFEEQGYGVCDGKTTSPPFDEDVINILYEDSFEVETSDGEELILSSYGIFKDGKWNMVKEALNSITDWYKTLENAILLHQVSSCLEEDIRKTHILANFTSFANDVEKIIRRESLNDLENFTKRARILVQELQTNKISIKDDWKPHWNKCLEFLKGEQNIDDIDFFKRCLQNIDTASTFVQLIEILFKAEVVKDVKGRILYHIDASTSKTTDQRLDNNLGKVIKGINFARFALVAGQAYMDSGRIKTEEKQPSEVSSLKDTADLMKEINYAFKASIQTDDGRKGAKKW